MLGNIPENLQSSFLRIANGLHQKAEYPKEKILRLFAEMLAAPKKFAYSKNKVTNLAREISSDITQITRANPELRTQFLFKREVPGIGTLRRIVRIVAVERSELGVGARCIRVRCRICKGIDAVDIYALTQEERS